MPKALSAEAVEAIAGYDEAKRCGLSESEAVAVSTAGLLANTRSVVLRVLRRTGKKSCGQRGGAHFPDELTQRIHERVGVANQEKQEISDAYEIPDRYEGPEREGLLDILAHGPGQAISTSRLHFADQQFVVVPVSDHNRQLKIDQRASRIESANREALNDIQKMLEGVDREVRGSHMNWVAEHLGIRVTEPPVSSGWRADGPVTTEKIIDLYADDDAAEYGNPENIVQSKSHVSGRRFGTRELAARGGVHGIAWVFGPAVVMIIGMVIWFFVTH